MIPDWITDQHPPRALRIADAWRANQIDLPTARELFREAMLEDRRVERMAAGLPDDMAGAAVGDQSLLAPPSPAAKQESLLLGGDAMGKPGGDKIKHPDDMTPRERASWKRAFRRYGVKEPASYAKYTMAGKVRKAKKKATVKAAAKARTTVKVSRHRDDCDDYGYGYGVGMKMPRMPRVR